LSAIGAEAEQERAAGIGADPDTGPLLRTLVRLRHDLVNFGRAAMVPLPEALFARIRSSLDRIAEAAGEYLLASSAALGARRQPPPLCAVDAALADYSATAVALRKEGLTRSLAAETAEHFFALKFALEQLRRNFKDLERCLMQCAEGAPAAVSEAARGAGGGD
jgi:hypothetical protein